jgi:NAD(P)-dependent dehydrogenase (short-subunit alcohol dehydrogenase family)
VSPATPRREVRGGRRLGARSRGGGGVSGRNPQLTGRTLLVIGGSSGIGLETARRAHDEGALVIITARDPERVQRAGLGVEGRIAAFDATDFHRLAMFFAALPTPIDHVLVTAPGRPIRLAHLDADEARRDLEAHLLLPLQVAREASNTVRPGGTLLFAGCTNGRDAIWSPSFTVAFTAALCAMTQRLASELASIRVNMIAVGFGDAPSRLPCSAISAVHGASRSTGTRRCDRSSAPPTAPHSPST